MSSRLVTLKQEFEQLYRSDKKYVLVDEAGMFVSGCGCEGLRIRPGGLRTHLLDSHGQNVTGLLVDTCAQFGIIPNLGYVQLVFGSRDLVESLYLVDACQACRSNLEESEGLAPVVVYYNKIQSEND